MTRKLPILLSLLLFVNGFAGVLKPPRGMVLNHGHPQSRGLVGCWLFNEGTGGKVYDLSGNGNTGTLIADAHFVPGKYGSCLDFDGNGDYVTIAHDSSFEPASSLTISVWVKVAGDGGNNPNQMIGHQNGYDGFRFGYNTTTDKFEFAVFTNDPSGVSTAISDVISTETWYHLVGVYDGTKSLIYVDGTKKTDGGALGGPLYYCPNLPMAFGHAAISAVYDFNGVIDEVMIFDRALTASEIALLYREPFCMFEQDDIVLLVIEAPPPSGGQIIIIQTSAIPLIFFTLFCLIRRRRCRQR